MGVPASRSGRLLTGMRPPATGSVSNVTRIAINKTARPSSRGFSSQAAVGSAVERDINISARPMTGQGMQGVSVRSGRKVYDLNFFQAELLNRNKLITEEIARLEQVTERLNSENSQAVKLSRERDVLRKAVDEMQGLLYDYSSVRTKLAQNETYKNFEELDKKAEARLKTFRETANSVYKERVEAERQMKEASQQVDKSRADIEAALQGIGEEKSAEIHKLANHNAELERQSKEMRDELLNLTNQASEAQWSARFDNSKRRVLKVHSEYIDLKQKKQALEKTLNELTSLNNTPNMIASLHEQIDIEQHKLKEEVQDYKDLQTRLKSQAALVKEAEQDNTIILTEVHKQSLEKLVKLEKFEKTYTPKLGEIETNLEVARKHVLALLMRIQTKTDEPTKRSGETQKDIDQRLAQRAIELQKITDLTKKVNDEIAELELRISDTNAKIDELLEIEKDKDHIPISQLKEETEEFRQKAEGLKQQIADENRKRQAAEQELEKPACKQLLTKVDEVAKMGSRYFITKEKNTKRFEESNYFNSKDKTLDLIDDLQKALLE